ncbi:phospholipase D family protein [Falsihalocynthiibacter sp. S25ZX9]|uniref:phospholipase D family protein n=1 Tax=Falsihalocynthiibacter sp. S25ZX9 TaxID=3240870 RepID=UPI00350E907F
MKSDIFTAPVPSAPCSNVMSLCLGCLLLLVAGCTHVPFEKNHTPTSATDILGSSRVTRVATQETLESGGKTTLIPLVSGNDALGARLRLIEAAEHTLDIQYFLIKPDLAGGIFARALIDAAERGVRVRFLLDDVFTSATDDEIALLNDHENIEMRLFNPLSRNATKGANFLLDFNRVNRRMHNKTLTADNAASIVGGRNIADEYFEINSDAEFADFDIFVMGPVTKDIAKSFDVYWNDPHSVPMENFQELGLKVDKESLQQDLRGRADQAEKDLYAKAMSSEFLAQVLDGTIQPLRGDAWVVTDTPQKTRNAVKVGPRTLSDELKQQILSAKSDVILMSPYFVPRPSDLAMFKALSRAGRRVVILTNSLAATNHAYVHGGYAPSRKGLLEAGVELYEIRADALQALGQLPPDSDVVLTMHTKAAVFDATTLFVGSLNYDPRSIEINTEFGMFIDSPELAKRFQTGVLKYIETHAYKLSLDPKGNILWTIATPQGIDVETSEPGASFSKKTIANITKFLPVKGQL